MQSLSGTGALRIGFEFLSKFYPNDVYLPNPTWATHLSIVRETGLIPKEFPYFDPQTKGIAYEELTKCLSLAKQNSIVLLHACAHNPTGVDPTEEQWRGIAKIIKERNLMPFFDNAYQGYASGDLEKDVRSLKIFIEEGIQFIVAQSLAKNFGLYGERIGALHIICTNQDVKDKVLSQVKLKIRTMYSSPPLHGARIVAKILGNPEYKAQWKVLSFLFYIKQFKYSQDELKKVSMRIQNMRALLRNELETLGVKGNWEHITTQIGMFSYTGLTEKQCEILTNKYHIYLLSQTGRISMVA